MKYKYKWTGGQDAVFPGLGTIPAGAEFITSKVIEGPGIEYVGPIDDENTNTEPVADEAGKDQPNG